MSHFSRIQTRLVEQPYLLKALKDLEYSYQTGDLDVHGIGFMKQKAEIVVKLPVSGRQVGFVRQGETYAIVADWWGIPARVRDEFQRKILQRYAYHAALDKLQAQGFNIALEETAQDGQVHITLRRMA